MTATVTQARNEMMATFKVAWDAAAVSQNVPVLYPDVSDDPPTSGAWARVTVVHDSGEQATLASHQGLRRYHRTGTIIVQLFTPAGGGQVLSDALGKVVTDAFEGVTTESGVIFRNVIPKEIGQDGAWFQVNVQAGFEYDEVR